MTEIRPDIDAIESGAELRRWYWLKLELAEHARRLNLSASGSKEDITERITLYLDTGRRTRVRRRAPSSSFDWANETLTLETIITDSYTNGPNVRAFFKKHYGPKFTFNIAFMDWMRRNIGKTLADAIEARREIAEREKHTKPAIPASNQYNAYTHDFHKANPDLGPASARACWAWKRSRPGHNCYEDSDLEALKLK